MLLELSPYAFKIGPIAVHWYGIFMAISFLVGFYYIYIMSQKTGLDEDFILNLVMMVIISGIIGARLMFVLTNYPSWFVSEPLQVFKVWEGGLAWHGGLLGGFLVGWPYCRKNSVNPNMIADWIVVGLSFGYIIVRIGNIFNQEVLGRMTQFSFGRWPAQLVGSAIGVVLLIRYFYLQNKDLPAGYQFWSFIWYHSVLRAVFEETVRENPLFLVHYINPRWGIGFFTLTQLITPFLILFAYFMYKNFALRENSRYVN
ncbi:MAG TPA: prolipoprotein diacylglyceryl transferase [Thermoanaerobacterales bacterium]|jgi:phosphatidylglycerol:prolipoprotein diacylglycerol transferase|nr:prolipoprotein diacylglyceryl transferase [Thermoanaerobacterales bacterium]